MIFSNPVYLWTMLGVLIPLAIHLWNQRKEVTIKVGSIKLLEESEPKRTSSVRLNELLLLALRIVLIIAVSLMLALPKLKESDQKADLVYVVEPDLLDSPILKGVLKNISKNQVRMFAPDFPVADKSPALDGTGKVPLYWQLAQELRGLPADSIVVLVNGKVSGIRGKRPTLPSHISWKVFDEENPFEAVISVNSLSDSLEFLTLYSDTEYLRYEKKKRPKSDSELRFTSKKDSIIFQYDTLKLSAVKPIKVLMFDSDSLAKEHYYLEAAFKAVSEYLDLQLSIESKTDKDSIDLGAYDVAIGLGGLSQSKPETKNLVFMPDAMADHLILDGKEPNQHGLTSYLNSENSTSEQLPEQLVELLDLRSDLAAKMAVYDQRTVPTQELRTVASSDTLMEDKANLTPISTWFWVVVFSLFILERIIAKFRKQ